MWLFTDYGFFSIVQKPSHPDVLTVRSRAREDLVRFVKLASSVTDTPVADIIDDEGTDYPFRARMPHKVVSATLAHTVEHIDYNNFKGRVGKSLGPNRAHLLMDVWHTMARLGLRRARR